MKDKNMIFYDFHLHSCLSPCGDADMTPNNIINMAKLKGLDAIAVIDHNTCGNCDSVIKVGLREGITVLPGMELCTSEDIHVVCLFKTLAGAISFEKEVRLTMPKVKNRSEIFGEQLLLDDMDNTVGVEDMLLISASGISVDSVLDLSRKCGGTAFPAHIDKIANGIIGILGAIPPETGFNTVELSPNCDVEKFLGANAELQKFKFLRNSDAHYLGDISEAVNCLLNVENCPESIIEYIDEK